jgi:hypothetical protein
MSSRFSYISFQIVRKRFWKFKIKIYPATNSLFASVMEKWTQLSYFSIWFRHLQQIYVSFEFVNKPSNWLTTTLHLIASNVLIIKFRLSSGILPYWNSNSIILSAPLNVMFSWSARDVLISMMKWRISCTL